MKKSFVFLIMIAAVVFVFSSCIKDSISYCPFCGSSSIEEVSVYDPSEGTTSIHYKCKNENCGKIFGAGQVQ
jgi:transposase-like protein